MPRVTATRVVGVLVFAETLDDWRGQESGGWCFGLICASVIHGATRDRLLRLHNSAQTVLLNVT